MATPRRYSLVESKRHRLSAEVRRNAQMIVVKGERPRRESVDETVGRLQTYIHRLERRYECSSKVMADAVKCDLVKETADISRWLSTYRVLLSLEDETSSGRMTGTRTTTT